jgi:hypothetical protein
LSPWLFPRRTVQRVIRERAAYRIDQDVARDRVFKKGKPGQNSAVTLPKTSGNCQQRGEI